MAYVRFVFIQIGLIDFENNYFFNPLVYYIANALKM